jgi:hypothetical protein
LNPACSCHLRSRVEAGEFGMCEVFSSVDPPPPSRFGETMTPVTIQGETMSPKNAAQIIIDLIEHMPEPVLLNLRKALDNLCEPEARFAIHDAYYRTVYKKRLN